MFFLIFSWALYEQKQKIIPKETIDSYKPDKLASTTHRRHLSQRPSHLDRRASNTSGQLLRTFSSPSSRNLEDLSHRPDIKGSLLLQVEGHEIRHRQFEQKPTTTTKLDPNTSIPWQPLVPCFCRVSEALTPGRPWSSSPSIETPEEFRGHGLSI